MNPHLAHKIRLYPTPEQESQFVQSCGTARFAYNWGLARWTELYGKGEKVDKFSLRREFNALKKTEFAWAREVTSRAPMNSLLQLGDAFARFFKKQAGRPVFKKKGKCQDSCYASIANKRKTFIDKLVKYLFDNFDRVVIEDLNVEGIAQFGNLARSIYDSAWRLFRTTLELKFKGTSKEVIVADRFFPSTKRCHVCGKINHALTLADRDWTCACGTYHDRDFNASMNLKLFPMLENAARLAVSACGDLDGRSMKQEFNPLFGG